MAFGLPISFGGGFDAGVGVANVGAALFGGNPNAGMMSIYQNMQDPMQGMYAAQNAATEDFIAQLQAQKSLLGYETRQQAQRIRKDATQFQKTQMATASNSGVLIEGSPVALLEETRKNAAQMIRDTFNRGLVAAQNIERQIGATRNETKARIFAQQIGFQTDRANLMAGLASGSGGGMSSAISGLGNLFTGGIGSFANPNRNSAAAVNPLLVAGAIDPTTTLRGTI